MNKLLKGSIILIILSAIMITGLYLIYTTTSSKSEYKLRINSESLNIRKKERLQIMKAAIEEEKTIKLLFVGDTMLSDFVGVAIEKEKRNPFQFMKDLFPKYDMIIANLECNISSPSTGTRQNKSYAFKAPMESLERLERSGIDLVSLANNHSMDYGPDALMEQIKLLEEINIYSFGAGKNIEEAFAPKYMEVKGIKFAFLGFNDIENIYGDASTSRPGFAFIERGKEYLVEDAIKDAKQNANYVVVFPHWGNERSTVVTSIQKYWAKLFIDNGADLVVGAHPHVIQPSEEYKGKMIYYSLGNFVFSGMDAPANVGEILEIVLYEGEISSFSTSKVKMTYHGFPQLLVDNTRN